MPAPEEREIIEARDPGVREEAARKVEALVARTPEQEAAREAGLPAP